MSEFRQDALRRHWVIVAEERAARPRAFRHAAVDPPESADNCPFCLGQEEQTPPALMQTPDPPEPWRVRVTSNKYPAVRVNGATPHDFPQRTFIGRAGAGRHEVIIESPQHLTRCTQLDDPQTEAVWRSYANRLRAASQSDSLKYARVFQNCGPTAGASIEHLHSQLIAMPFVPNESAREVERLQAWSAERGRAGLLDVIAAERDDGSRMLAESDGLVAFCPYASRFPYEVWIAPTERSPRFEASDDERLASIGKLVREVVTAFDRVLQSPDYNYLIQSCAL